MTDISTDQIGDTAMSTFRLRRCNANKDAWVIVLMRDDGQESEIAHCCVTGMTPGDTLNTAVRTELFQPDDTLQIYESITRTKNPARPSLIALTPYRREDHGPLDRLYISTDQIGD